MARTKHPSHVPFQRKLDRAIAAPPSATDGVGGVYVYFTQHNAKRVAKIGKADAPVVRQAQWARQCHGELQRWLPFYWEVRFAKKFERIVHLQFKRMGAWLGRVECRHCGTRHQEKFDLRKCGGVAGLIAVIEHRLGLLGWVWRRVYF
ncbi:hypothetical protein K438DRAFT_1975077 [Mycena galopus ATCC 62051]|nr:hypothetical protein K438DRAFT_1975077 [Mycena galopus ATCC 62051]